VTSTPAARNNYRDHGHPTRGLYFGRDPRRPAAEPTLVQFERHGRGITLRGADGERVDGFGDTAVFWLAPAPELRAPTMTCHRPGCGKDLSEHYSSDRLPGGNCDTDHGRELAQIRAWTERHGLGHDQAITAERIIAARDADHDAAIEADTATSTMRSPDVSGAWAGADEDERERLLDQAHAEALDERAWREQDPFDAMDQAGRGVYW
jgi:hypothetical protein